MLCPAGLGLDISQEGWQSCRIWDGGRFKARAGNEACTFCPDGAASSLDGTMNKCPEGTFFTVGSTAYCKSCPAGRFTKTELLATSFEFCSECSCDERYYWRSFTRTCEPCRENAECLCEFRNGSNTLRQAEEGHYMVPAYVAANE